MWTATLSLGAQVREKEVRPAGPDAPRQGPVTQLRPQPPLASTVVRGGFAAAAANAVSVALLGVRQAEEQARFQGRQDGGSPFSPQGGVDTFTYTILDDHCVGLMSVLT